MKTTKIILLTLVLAIGCKPRAKDSKADGFGTGRVSLKGTYGVRRGPRSNLSSSLKKLKPEATPSRSASAANGSPTQKPRTTPTDAALLRSFHGPVGAPAYGLSTSKLSIDKVPEGWTNGSFETTGYILFTDAGPAEHHQDATRLEDLQSSPE